MVELSPSDPCLGCQPALALLTATQRSAAELVSSPAFRHTLLLHPSSGTSSLAPSVSHLALLSRPFMTHCRSLTRICSMAGPLQWSLSLTIIFPRKCLSSFWVLSSHLGLPMNTQKSTLFFSCSHSSCLPYRQAWFPSCCLVFHPHLLLNTLIFFFFFFEDGTLFSCNCRWYCRKATC